LAGSPAFNVAETYLRLAHDLREGITTAPTFNDALIRHRMLADIEQAALTGQRLVRSTSGPTDAKHNPGGDGAGS
jgi:hypothetical protein